MNIIIVGGGQTGSYLASILSSNHDVRLVESRKHILAKLEQDLPKGMVVAGTGSDPATLERAGILKADVVIAVTGDDEVNLVVSMLAKMEYGVNRVVARVNNPKNSWMFNQGMGVDVGINQADIMARFVQEGLNLKDVYTIMKLGRDEHAIVQAEVHPDSLAAGAKVKDIELPSEAVIVAIERAGETIVPHGDTILVEGDDVIVFTDSEGRSKIKRVFV
ncbi:MAG: NAD-binding protein [Atopobiaceae bacterium]|jgi:trk system potassium uptake protein TrkA